MNIRALRRTVGLVVLGLLTMACGIGSTGPQLGEADLRILFVGNSLTYSNDLPGLVETIAEAAGKSVETAMIAHPNYSLEDHWNSGIANDIRRMKPDLVVMQQGPSSLPENQEYLRQWAVIVSEVIKDEGGTPALMMVWPELARVHAYDAVRDAYNNAAIAVDGDFIPSGEAFRAVLAIPGMIPYAPDLFHPSHLGSVTAAAMVVRVYFPGSMEGLGASIIPTDSDNPRVNLTASEASVVWSVVDRVAAEWGH